MSPHPQFFNPSLIKVDNQVTLSKGDSPRWSGGPGPIRGRALTARLGLPGEEEILPDLLSSVLKFSSHG